jgi:PAS domain S-box-containing protein
MSGQPSFLTVKEDKRGGTMEAGITVPPDDPVIDAVSFPRVDSQVIQTLVESLSDTLYTLDLEGKLRYVSQGWTGLLGDPVEEVLGRPFSDFIHPDDLSICQAGIQAMVEGRQRADGVTYRVRHRNGNWKWHTSNATPIYDCRGLMIGMVGLARDVTETLHLTEDWRILTKAVTQSPATILITNAEGEIEFANPAFSRTTGYSFDEARGKNPRILNSGFHSDEFYKSLWQAIRGAGEWRGEICNRRKNGELYWESASISAIKDSKDNITHFVAVKEDISDWKKVQAELLLAKESAERAREQAQTANVMKTSFLANMSHEIRTPMNAIVGFSVLMLESGLNEIQTDYMLKIREAGDHLLGIINSILDISKIELGGMVVESIPFQLDHLLADVQAICESKARTKGLEFRIERNPGIPGELVGDQLRLRQVLVNLLDNAIKFTEHGSVSLMVEDGTGTDLKVGDRLRVSFTVKDTGIGISEEQQQRLFQPFSQADASTTRRFGGTGLGLSISKRLVDIMGGELKLDSLPSQGSSFHFQLQLVPVKDPPNEPWKLQMENHGETSLKGLRILVAEDDPISAKIVGHFLSGAGASYTVVVNGCEAVHQVIGSPESFDLVLMDIQMPQLDGFSAIRRIRQDGRFADLPIVAVTAHAFEEERRIAFDAGVDDYLTKPIDRRHLLSLVSQLVSEAKARHPGAGPKSRHFHAPRYVETETPGMRPGTLASDTVVNGAALDWLQHLRAALGKGLASATDQALSGKQDLERLFGEERAQNILTAISDFNYQKALEELSVTSIMSSSKQVHHE